MAASEFRDGRYSLKTSWPGPAMRGTPLLTWPGEEDLLATRNPEETRSIAQKLAWILSRSMRDTA